MSRLPAFIAILIAYLAFAKLSLSLSNPKHKARLFALANITSFICLSLFTSYSEWKDETILSLGGEAVVRHVSLIGLYVLLVAFGYLLMRSLSKREGLLP